MSYCSNVSCPAQMYRWVTHFTSVMEIEGLGEQWAGVLLERGLIKDPADLYYLTNEQLVELPRMGPVLAAKILANIEASEERGLGALLFALGIRHVGGEVAQVLANHFHTMDALSQASEEELQEAEAIGPTIAHSVFDYLRDPQKRKIIDKLKGAGVGMEQKRRPRVEGPLAGQSFVFTGTLAAMPRGRAEGIVVGLGAEAGSSVTRKTTYLVAGADPGAKLQKAQKYGTTILNEEQFLRLLREHGVQA
jgi:DNA ligase (NAD+)